MSPGGSLARAAAIVTSSVDVPGGEKLDWERFFKIVLKQMRCMRGVHLSSRELRHVFDSTCILDRRGYTVKMDDVFQWSMAAASSVDAGGVERCFRLYDASGEGVLDPMEFFALAEDHGFGDQGNDLMTQLDDDGSNSISYSEIVMSIRRNKVPSSAVARRFLLTLAFDGVQHIGSAALAIRGGARARGRLALDMGQWPHSLAMRDDVDDHVAVDELRTQLMVLLTQQVGCGIGWVWEALYLTSRLSPLASQHLSALTHLTYISPISPIHQ